MKKIKSFLLIAFVMILSLNICTFADESKLEYDEKNIKEDAEAMYEKFAGYVELSDFEIDYVCNYGNDGESIDFIYQKALQAIKEVNEDTGAFDAEKELETSIRECDGYVEVTVTGIFEKAKVTICMDYYEFNNGMYPYDFTAEKSVITAKKSLKESLTDAALNTVMGLFTVFAVLILIAFIISLFKYIAVIEKKLAEKKARKESGDSTQDNMVDNTVAQIIAKEESNLADDLELVAVIAAAIAEYEGTTTDSFVVRSINRRQSNWRKA